MDDTYVVWPHGREELDRFLGHLDNQNYNIRFTMEIERNMSLPFLDVLISKNDDGSISHQVYRKKTHTDRYLHAKSHPYPPQNTSGNNTMVVRAMRISDKAHLKQEINHLADLFLRNGYNENQ